MRYYQNSLPETDELCKQTFLQAFVMLTHIKNILEYSGKKTLFGKRAEMFGLIITVNRFLMKTTYRVRVSNGGTLFKMRDKPYFKGDFYSSIFHPGTWVRSLEQVSVDLETKEQERLNKKLELVSNKNQDHLNENYGRSQL